MAGIKLTTVVEGVDSLSRALKLANPAIKARVVAAIHKNTEAVKARALSAAPVKTGEMASTIRSAYLQPDQLTGFVRVGLGRLPRRSRATTAKGQRRFGKLKRRGRPIGRGAYAPVVERGDPRRHHAKHPFLIPSFQAQRPTAVRDITKALNDTVVEIRTGR